MTGWWWLLPTSLLTMSLVTSGLAEAIFAVAAIVTVLLLEIFGPMGQR